VKVTRTRVLVVWLLAALVVAAIAGPSHIGIIVLVVAAAFVGVIGLGVVIGVRDGLAGAREEGAAEPGEETPSRL